MSHHDRRALQGPMQFGQEPVGYFLPISSATQLIDALRAVARGLELVDHERILVGGLASNLARLQYGEARTPVQRMRSFEECLPPREATPEDIADRLPVSDKGFERHLSTFTVSQLVSGWTPDPYLAVIALTVLDGPTRLDVAPEWVWGIRDSRGETLTSGRADNMGEAIADCATRLAVLRASAGSVPDPVKP